MYLAKIEEYFTQKRGQGLILSPKDWQLAQEWEQDGIPLQVVLRGINRSFEQVDSSKQIRSLVYCEPEIKRLWQEYKEQRAGDSLDEGNTEEDLSCSPRLMELKDCLEVSLRELYSPEIIGRLTLFKLSVYSLSVDNWEIVLGEITKQLVSHLRELIDSQEWDAIKTEAQNCLQGYETRMSEPAYQQTFDSLINERLLEKYKLGPFSIYAD